MTNAARSLSVALNPIASAIEELFARMDAANARAAHAEATAAAERASATSFEILIDQLIEQLPADQRGPYERRLGVVKHPTPSAKGGEVFDNVVHLVRTVPNRTWTAATVQEELRQRGVEADAKSIANILAYLAKNGKLVRVARGQYVSQGWMLVTSDDLSAPGFGHQEHSEHNF